MKRFIRMNDGKSGGLPWFFDTKTMAPHVDVMELIRSPTFKKQMKAAAKLKKVKP